MDRIGAAPNGRRQLQKIRPDQWTREKRERFLDLLAATANASYSARDVGMSAWGAFALRRRDPAFAALWHAALDTAYAVIETKLLARAIGGPDADDPANAIEPGASLTDADKAAIEADFDPRLAQDLLKRRDAQADARQRPGPAYKVIPPEEIARVLERQLAVLRKREDAKHGA